MDNPRGRKDGHRRDARAGHGGVGGTGKPQGESRQPDNRRNQRKPYGDKPFGENQRKPYGDKPYGENQRKPYGDKPYSENQRKPYGDKPYGENQRKPYGDKPYGENQRKPYGDKPYSENQRKPYGDKPYGENQRKPYGDKPYGQDRRKPYQGKPYAERGNYPQAPQPDVPAVRDEDELPLLVFGRNPVREAVKSGRAIDRILVQDDPDGSLREIITMAKERGLVVQNASRRKLDEMCMPFGHGERTGHHQGIVAQMPGCDYVTLQDILQGAKDKGEAPFVLVLDGITDPHNLGAILRSAACFGAHGVVLPKRRAVGVTSAVVRASAGAAAVVPVARVTNLTDALKTLKSAGLWIAGADMQGESASQKDMRGALALVIGAEEGGLSLLVRQTCDFLVGIRITGPIGSLNASVAAGVLMAEKRRQDGV